MLKAAGAFIRKYWRELLLFAAAGVVMALIQALDRSTDDAIAGMMADKALRQVRARDAAIVAKYSPQLAAKDAELAAIRSAQVAAVAQVGERDRQLTAARAKVKDLAGCKALLERQQAEAKQRAEADNDRFNAMDAAHVEKYALLEKQNGERISSLGGDLAQQIKDNARLRLQLRRRLAVGPVAGYGPGGAFVGVGVMYEVVRIKAPWN
jgi:hypothetical protein